MKAEPWKHQKNYSMDFSHKWMALEIVETQ